MSRNLVKQSCVVEAGETRIIDTNELLRRRRENEAREQADQSREGFTSGLDAEEVQIPADGGEGSESGVIKAGEDGKATLDQAREEAREILEKANREAEDIIAAARAQAEAEKRSILDQARHQGYVDGQSKAHQESEAAKAELQRQARSLEEEYQKMVDELEPKFVDVITSAYEHVFQVELSGDRKILEYLISNTMHRLEGGGSFLIHVSRMDYEEVLLHRQEILAGTASGVGTVEIVEDLTLGENECLIETDGGIFDCGLGTQLAGLKQKLMLLAWSREE